MPPTDRKPEVRIAKRYSATAVTIERDKKLQSWGCHLKSLLVANIISLAVIAILAICLTILATIPLNTRSILFGQRTTEEMIPFMSESRHTTSSSKAQAHNIDVVVECKKLPSNKVTPPNGSQNSTKCKRELFGEKLDNVPYLWKKEGSPNDVYHYILPISLVENSTEIYNNPLSGKHVISFEVNLADDNFPQENTIAKHDIIAANKWLDLMQVIRRPNPKRLRLGVVDGAELLPKFQLMPSWTSFPPKQSIVRLGFICASVEAKDCVAHSERINSEPKIILQTFVVEEKVEKPNSCKGGLMRWQIVRSRSNKRRVMKRPQKRQLAKTSADPLTTTRKFAGEKGTSHNLKETTKLTTLKETTAKPESKTISICDGLNLLPGENGWCTFQKNSINTTANMMESWSKYKFGFTYDGNKIFWGGLETLLHNLTNSTARKLRISWRIPDGYIEYDGFWVEEESHRYRLHLGKRIRGTVPDIFFKKCGRNKLHKFFQPVGHQFATYDNDLDCTSRDKGGQTTFMCEAAGATIQDSAVAAEVGYGWWLTAKNANTELNSKAIVIKYCTNGKISEIRPQSVEMMISV